MDLILLSEILRFIVLSAYSILILGTLDFLIMNYREKLSIAKIPNREFSKEDPLNLLLILIILIFEMAISQIKIDYIMSGPKQVVVVFMVGTPIILGIFFIFSQIIQKIRGKKKLRRWGFYCEKGELTEKEKTTIDFQRKGFHILLYSLIVIGLLIGNYVLHQKVAGLSTNDSNYIYYTQKLTQFWGSTNGLNFLGNIFNLSPFSVSRGILVLIFSVSSMVLLTIEMTRLSTKFHFPLHKTIQRNLRQSELDSYASYTHFILGYSFAAVMLPSLLFVASLGIICFGDVAASTIGMKFGKHKIKISKNGKSWEGTIAGFVFSFIPVFVFAGPIYALVASIVFALIDVFTPHPIKANDNVLVPVAITAVFIVLSVIGIPSINFLGI